MTGTRTLLLHIGLPKTASSALQYWADRNRQFLLDHGVHYPPGSDAVVPKHQDLVGALFQGDWSALDTYLEKASAPTLFLSTEGLSNHLYDFPSATLAAFRERTVDWRVRLFMVIRPRESWITSFWKQALLNPRNERFDYATNLTRDAFSELPRTRRLADFEQVLQTARNAYGAADAVVADQGSDWFETFRTLLGLPDTLMVPDHEHISISQDLAEIIRQLNDLTLNGDLRAQILALTQHSMATQHEILIAHALERPLRTLAQNATEITQCLAQIAPSTPEQTALISAMTATLASVGSEENI